MTEKDLEIQNLKIELKKTKKKLNYINKFINKECIYDEHLQGFIFDLPKGKVRTLMYELNKDQR